MAKRSYNPTTIKLPFKDVVELHQAGDLDLEIDRPLYIKLFTRAVPVTEMFRNNMNFWRNAAWMIFFISSILLIVLSAWYWVVMSVLVGGYLAMTQNNLQLEQDQLMEQAIVAVLLNDENYYNTFLSENESGWHYMIDPAKAEPYLKGNAPKAKAEVKAEEPAKPEPKEEPKEEAAPEDKAETPKEEKPKKKAAAKVKKKTPAKKKATPKKN